MSDTESSVSLPIFAIAVEREKSRREPMRQIPLTTADRRTRAVFPSEYLYAAFGEGERGEEVKVSIRLICYRERSAPVKLFSA